MTAQQLSLQTSDYATAFLDVAGINAHLSRTIAQRLSAVAADARLGRHVPAKAYVIVGPAGGGKTHILARLRCTPGAHTTLVMLRPYFGVSIGLRDVLAAVVDQLCARLRESSLSEIESICAYWLAAATAGGRAASRFPAAAIDEVRGLSATDRSFRVEAAVRDLLSLLPTAQPLAHVATAVLRLAELDDAARWAELAWLSGREPRAGSEATTAGALTEADIVQVVRILAVLAAPVAPIVLAFDQLENLSGSDDVRVLGFGNLVSELVDTIPSLTVLQLALTSEWMQFIEPRLSLPQKTRMAGETFQLDSPTPTQRAELLRAWHEHATAGVLESKHKRFPAPLSKVDYEMLLVRPGMTPRLLLLALQRAFAGKPLFPETAPAAAVAPDVAAATDSALSAFNRLWNYELAQVTQEIAKKIDAGQPLDAAELAEAIGSVLSFVPHLEVVSHTERERQLMRVTAPGAELALVFATAMHHIAVGSTFSRAYELAQLGKTVIVRERRFELPATWTVVQQRRAQFEQLPNARWLWLDTAELADCVNLARMLSKVRAKRLRYADTVPVGHDRISVDGEVDAAEPFTLDAFRARIVGSNDPRKWRITTTIHAWMSDVPRAPVAAVSPSASVRSVQAPLPPAPASAATSAAPTLREWLGQGTRMGKSLILHYREKLRARGQSK